MIACLFDLDARLLILRGIENRQQPLPRYERLPVLAVLSPTRNAVSYLHRGRLPDFGMTCVLNHTLPRSRTTSFVFLKCQR
jgi:hypothetical protein